MEDWRAGFVLIKILYATYAGAGAYFQDDHKTK